MQWLPLLYSRLRKDTVHTKTAEEISKNDADGSIAQDGQTGLFCLSGSSCLSGLTKQTRQTKYTK